MDDEEKLALLAEALLSDPRFARGKRPFPRQVSDDEAADLVLSLCRQVDRGAEARAQAAAHKGLPVVCDRGCNGCCEELVMATRPEAVAVCRWLLKEENAGARAAFLGAYPRWRLAAGDGPERLADLLARGDQQGYVEAHRGQWRLRVMCAFNQGGDCTIYPVRPPACRNAHAIETSARCSGANTSGRPAARLAFPALDEYLEGVEQLLSAAHHAVGGARSRPLALCEAVYRLLQSEQARAGRRGRRPAQ